MDPGSMAIIWLLLATVSLLVALGMYSWRSPRRWRASRLAWLLRAPACLGQITLLDFAPTLWYTGSIIEQSLPSVSLSSCSLTNCLEVQR